MAKLSNGELLKAAAAAGFEVLLTVDQNLSKQQRIGELPIAVIVVVVRSNTEPELLPHARAILAILSQRLQPRVYTVTAVAPPRES